MHVIKMSHSQIAVTTSLYITFVDDDGHNVVIAISLSYLPTCRAVHNSKLNRPKAGGPAALKGEPTVGKAQWTLVIAHLLWT
jgi:hypothetical protein